ncbi:hypothetical protein DFH09DRAFT_1197610 [Mycena vulgaris]|nr:hypothetical protein DFH09DRAFT_1197610 [Mycena vulgaris]
MQRSSPDGARPSLGLPDGSTNARDTLQLALKTLSSVSSNIPFGSILIAVIDPLLAIMGHIEEAWADARGFTVVAEQIELVTPIISEMAVDNPEQGRVLIDALKLELQSITKDLKAARSQDRLELLNSTDPSSSLGKHKLALAQMIHAGQTDMGDIAGRLGAAGVSGLDIGGEGGEGNGPKVEISCQTGNISGGTGGTGGTGKVGGKGGTGKAPVLKLGRN